MDEERRAESHFPAENVDTTATTRSNAACGSIGERNIERARCQLECQAIGVPRARRKRPVTAKAL